MIDKRNAVTNRPEPSSKHMRKPAGRSITQFASNRRSQKIMPTRHWKRREHGARSAQRTQKTWVAQDSALRQ